MVATGLPPGRSQRFRDAAYLEGPRALQLRRKKGSAPAKKAAELSELALGLVPLAEVRSKALPTKTFKFTVDCQQPAEDTIIEPKDAPGAGSVLLRPEDNIDNGGCLACFVGLREVFDEQNQGPAAELCPC